MRRLACRHSMARACLPVAAVIAALAIFGCGGSNESTQLNGITETNLPDAPSVSLPAYGEGYDGEMRKLRPSSGKLMLVYFGYTSCPDVCPTSMSALGAAVRSLPTEQQDQIEVGMVTADPARDTGDDLIEYLGHFFRKQPVYAFRTTDEALLRSSEKAFGAASEIEPHAAGENYSVTHTAFIYAVDRNGQVVVMWPFGATSTDMAADLKALLDEQDQSPNQTS